MSLPHRLRSLSTLLNHSSNVNVHHLFSSLSDCQHHLPRSLTPPHQSQLQSFLSHPSPTPSDLNAALLSQSDPDLALDLFRWSQSHNNHPPLPSSSYFTILTILLRHRRFSASESLLHQILSGACPPSLPLFNLLIHFSSSRRHLFSTSFDLYKSMLRKTSPIRPDLTTYKLLLCALLRRFGRPPVSYIHLHSLRSLVRQMKALGIIPDLYTLNIVIKAYAKCLEMREAVRVFREMGLYGCEPNAYSYGYVVKGMVEKGWVEEGMKWYREMKGKGLVATSGVYMTVINGLAMERRFEEGKEVLGDLLGCGMRADLLTYRTLLEGLCREGRGDEAFQLLEELGRRKGAMDPRMHDELLDGLHWFRRQSTSI